MAGADAIDGRGHYDVGFYTSLETSLDYTEVCLALPVWLRLIAHLLVGVDVLIIVGKDPSLLVGVCDGLVAQIGCAGCL